MTADRKIVGATFHGILKTVDADNGKITVSVNASDKSAGEEMMFVVAKEPKLSAGKSPILKLADLPVGARISLTMSADQKKVIGGRVDPR